MVDGQNGIYRMTTSSMKIKMVDEQNRGNRFTTSSMKMVDEQNGVYRITILSMKMEMAEITMATRKIQSYSRSRLFKMKRCGMSKYQAFTLLSYKDFHGHLSYKGFRGYSAWTKL